MLKEIAIVTIVVTNLSQVQTGWEKLLGYTVASRGSVSEELSYVWNAQEMTAADYIIMQPANGAPVYIRFVEDETAADYQAMTTYGWNATELLVKDPDSLYASIEGQYFEVVGKPRDLWDAPDAPRAFQAYGPGRDMLYLTSNSQAVAALGLEKSMPAVERAFIMVLGGSSMEDFRNFYGDKLGLNVGEPMAFQLATFSRINNLAADAKYPLAIVNTAPGYMIELDELPKSIPAREAKPNRLPPGIAIVGFHSDGISGDLDWISALRPIDEFPYNGRAVGLLRGPAGELVEVIIKPQQ